MNGLAIRVVDGGLQRDFARSVGLIDDLGLYADHSLFGRNPGRADEDAPLVDVDRISADEANVAIDALAGVPAGSRLEGGIGADSKDIRLVIAEV